MPARSEKPTSRGALAAIGAAHRPSRSPQQCPTATSAPSKRSRYQAAVPGVDLHVPAFPARLASGQSIPAMPVVLNTWGANAFSPALAHPHGGEGFETVRPHLFVREWPLPDPTSEDWAAAADSWHRTLASSRAHLTPAA